MVMLALTLLGMSFFKNERVFNTVRDAKDVKDCKKNLTAVYESMLRYRQINDEFPEKLEDLWPKFLETRDPLHCPVDPNAGEISYEYTRPDDKTPPDAVVLTCRWHMITEKGTPLVLTLQKDGTIISKQVDPPSPEKP